MRCVPRAAVLDPPARGRLRFGGMQLLVAVINDPGRVGEILSGLHALGITGATVITSEGMGSRLSQDIPLFARLNAPIAGLRPENRVIFSVVDDEHVEPAIAVLQEVCGSLNDPGTGIAFTMRLDRVEGLARRLGDGTS